MTVSSRQKKVFLVLAFFAVAALAPQSVFAHCDTLEGPVVKTARVALDAGDVTPVLKWVRSDDEREIRGAFEKTLAMRSLGPEAKEFADMYFFETLVRIHRAGEEAPYTGLKPGEAIDPAVSMADKALESGSIEKLITVLNNAMAKGIRERFAHAYESRKHADKSVAQGREFVDSYVVFTHYVEGMHNLIKGGGAHNDKTESSSDKGHGH